MRALWDKCVAFYEVLSQREQILMASVLLIIFTGVWYLVLFNPLEVWGGDVAAQTVLVKNQSRTLRDDLMLINAKLAKDPDIEIKRMRKKLQQDLQALGAQLDVYDNQLISLPRLMDAMRDVLKKEPGIELVALTADPDETPITNKGHKVFLYRQGLEITFQGDFFATLDYLNKLEGLRWRLFWDKMDYRVLKYPVAEVTLHVHTFSDQA
jgi:MSHA biogenesis protein MshJ